MSPNQMTCEQVLERVLEFIDRELSGEEHADLEHHLESCRSCYSRVEFERRLKTRLTALAQEDAPDPLRDRVSRLIKDF